MKCDVCGKGMNNLDGSKIEGFVLNLTWHTDKTPELERLVQNQFGPYENRNYHICLECCLRAMGVPEPKE